MTDSHARYEQLLARFRPFAQSERQEEQAVIFTLPFGTEIWVHPDGADGVTVDIMAPISCRSLTLGQGSDGTLDQSLAKARNLSLLAAQCDQADLEPLITQHVSHDPELERMYDDEGL